MLVLTGWILGVHCDIFIPPIIHIEVLGRTHKSAQVSFLSLHKIGHMAFPLFGTKWYWLLEIANSIMLLFWDTYGNKITAPLPGIAKHL